MKLLLALVVLLPLQIAYLPVSLPTADEETLAGESPLGVQVEYATLVGATLGAAARCGADRARLQVIRDVFLDNANGYPKVIGTFRRAMEPPRTGEAGQYCGEAMARLHFLEEKAVR